MSSSNSSNSGNQPAGDGGKLRFLSYIVSSVIRSLGNIGQEKQKMLLSAETGHFSMIRSVSCDSGAEMSGRVFAHFEFVL